MLALRADADLVAAIPAVPNPTLSLRKNVDRERTRKPVVVYSIVRTPLGNLTGVGLYVDSYPPGVGCNYGGGSRGGWNCHCELLRLGPGESNIIPFGHAELVIAVYGENTVNSLAIRGTRDMRPRSIEELGLKAPLMKTML